MSQESFLLVIERFCKQLEIEMVEADENGYYSFILYGEIEINIEYDEESRGVYLFCSPGNLPDKGLVAFQREMLESNVYRMGDQPCLAILEDMVMLVFDMPIEVADPFVLQAKITGLCSAWSDWKDKLEMMPDEEDGYTEDEDAFFERETSFAQFLRLRA
ncbi:type III secretion system chaperone [Acanthopleuribacter pedis]|uniref:Type III secretion system chaperone n=1 Tax=Acanthopleuribacter pedis TaxID=442870 RepID=A0A8J7QD67_9BACT|nr:type III secretion system chaperone [Acanthopleuribacter pedis]MBO1321255.1 type III secretion system chaperone [Acanthopleuribacter pedis]